MFVGHPALHRTGPPGKPDFGLPPLWATLVLWLIFTSVRIPVRHNPNSSPEESFKYLHGWLRSSNKVLSEKPFICPILQVKFARNSASVQLLYSSLTNYPGKASSTSTVGFSLPTKCCPGNSSSVVSPGAFPETCSHAEHLCRFDGFVRPNRVS